MKLGLHINDFAWPVAADHLANTVAEIGQAGEAAGFATIAVMDHLWQHPYGGGGPEAPVLEGDSTLAFLAGLTKQARLMGLATPVSTRFPGLWAKRVTPREVLSRGRAALGVGVGDYEAEARGLGIPYPSTAERYGLLEETIQVCLRMWQGGHGGG